MHQRCLVIYRYYCSVDLVNRLDHYSAFFKENYSRSPIGGTCPTSLISIELHFLHKLSPRFVCYLIYTQNKIIFSRQYRISWSSHYKFVNSACWPTAMVIWKYSAVTCQRLYLRRPNSLHYLFNNVSSLRHVLSSTCSRLDQFVP